MVDVEEIIKINPSTFWRESPIGTLTISLSTTRNSVSKCGADQSQAHGQMSGHNGKCLEVVDYGRSKIHRLANEIILDMIAGLLHFMDKAARMKINRHQFHEKQSQADLRRRWPSKGYWRHLERQIGQYSRERMFFQTCPSGSCQLASSGN
jgi:hypothetical protein